MKTSQTGLNLIEEYEGLILGAYDDANDHVVPIGGTVRGTLTIGYGHTTAAGPPKVTIGQKITKAQANEILAADLSRVESSVNKLVRVPINQNQFDALVSFQFNTGGLARSSVLTKLNKKDYQGAADALLLWNRGNGQVLAGLIRRRKAERALFLTKASNVPTVIKTAVGGSIAAGGASVAAAPHQWHWILAAVIGALVITAVGAFIYSKETK
jgi:lysozyme